jgi:HAMP domain-containing protein
MAVPYLISAVAVAAGVVVLLTALVRLGGPLRRLADTARQSRAHFADRVGALAARIAALRVAVNQRRHRDGDSSRPARAA